MSEEKKEFVVKDRRIFAGAGNDQEKPKAEKTPEKEKPGEQSPPSPDQGKTGQPAAQKPQAEATAGEAVSDKTFKAETQLPEINFVTFVLSLNASALVNLGLVEDPASNAHVKNLPLAKQTIDILGMLQEKTRGNLSADEENLIKHVLYELRMFYVKEKK